VAAQKAAPVPTPETAPYWEAANRGELRLQRCRDCDAFYFYPRPFCPTCLGGDVEWETLSGRATLLSYTINHRPVPGWEADGPYVIAMVQLEEGPTMMSNIVGVEATPEALELDMPLEVQFDDRGDQKVPVFRPAGRAR
jgi:uncharacterized OB-fold protein